MRGLISSWAEQVGRQGERNVGPACRRKAEAQEQGGRHRRGGACSPLPAPHYRLLIADR